MSPFGARKWTSMDHKFIINKVINKVINPIEDQGIGDEIRMLSVLT